MARNITVTFADGTTHVYQNAPDNVTPEMVQERATKEFGKQITHLDGGRAQSNTPTTDTPSANVSAPKAQPKQSPQYLKALNEARYLANQTNGLERAFGQGTAANFGDELQAGVNAGVTGLNNLGAKVGLTKGAGFSMQDAYKATMQAENEAQQKFQKEHPAQSVTANIVGGIASPLSKIGGGYIAKGTTLGSAALRGGAVGAGMGALYGSGEGQTLEERGQNALGGGVTGGVLGAGSPYLGKIVKGTVSYVMPDLGSESVKRLQSAGTDLTYGQMIGGPVKYLEDKLALFSGGMRSAQHHGVEQWNRSTMNKVLSGIGQKLNDTTKIGYDGAREFQRKIGDYYDAASKAAKFSPDAKFAQDIKDLGAKLVGVDDGTRQQAQSLVNQFLKGPISRTNVMTGNDLSHALSQLKAVGRSTDNVPLSNFISDLNRRVLEAIHRTDSVAAKNLIRANKAYAESIPVEMAQTAAGETNRAFTPSELSRNVKKSAGGARRREFGKGGALMQQESSDASGVLKSSAKTSGTAENMASLGLGGAAIGGLLSGNPILAAQILAAKTSARVLYSKPVLKMVNDLARASTPKSASKAFNQLQIASKNNPQAKNALGDLIKNISIQQTTNAMSRENERKNKEGNSN